MENKKTCFVVCPISGENTDTRKRSDEVFEFIIKEVCSKFEYECIRVDHLKTNTAITNDILENLKSADIVIADITESNPNVFLEIGYRMALKKDLILIKEKGTNNPFDIHNIRTFEYDLTSLPSVAKIKSDIKDSIINIQRTQKNNLNIQNSDQEINNDNLINNKLAQIQDDIINLKANILNEHSKIIELLENNYSDNENKKSTSIENIFAEQLAQEFSKSIINDPKKTLGFFKEIQDFKND